MIQLDEETAIIIEDAAAESLKQFGSEWTALTKDELLNLQSSHLNEVIQFNGIPLNQILDGMSAQTFMSVCVKLAVIQTLLNKKPGYRDLE